MLNAPNVFFIPAGHTAANSKPGTAVTEPDVHDAKDFCSRSVSKKVLTPDLPVEQTCTKSQCFSLTDLLSKKASVNVPVCVEDLQPWVR